MTPENAYDAWAPRGGRWSTWAKPVLFSHMDDVPEASGDSSSAMPGSEIDTIIAMIPNDDTLAVVVDLPGVDSVMLGLRLARERGVQPVPLFNAVPAPRRLASGSDALLPPLPIDIWPIIDALAAGVVTLRDLPPFRPSAPPVFLLDARRRGNHGLPASPAPGTFDNRSISLPTDFPSANLLLASGVRRALLVQQAADHPATDLAHTLRRWQDAGIPISLLTDESMLPRPITVIRPRWYRWMWHNLLVRTGLRRHPLGGFGSYLPDPTSSSSSGG